jgi:hypothetical protein
MPNLRALWCRLPRRLDAEAGEADGEGDKKRRRTSMITAGASAASRSEDSLDAELHIELPRSLTHLQLTDSVESAHCTNALLLAVSRLSSLSDLTLDIQMCDPRLSFEPLSPTHLPTLRSLYILSSASSAPDSPHRLTSEQIRSIRALTQLEFICAVPARLTLNLSNLSTPSVASESAAPSPPSSSPPLLLHSLPWKSVSCIGVSIQLTNESACALASGLPSLTELHADCRGVIGGAWLQKLPLLVTLHLNLRSIVGNADSLAFGLLQSTHGSAPVGRRLH